MMMMMDSIGSMYTENAVQNGGEGEVRWGRRGLDEIIFSACKKNRAYRQNLYAYRATDEPALDNARIATNVVVTLMFVLYMHIREKNAVLKKERRSIYQ